MFEGLPPGRSQSEIVSRELGSSADADAVAEPRYRSLVGLVHYGGDGRGRSVRDLGCQ